MSTPEGPQSSQPIIEHVPGISAPEGTDSPQAASTEAPILSGVRQVGEVPLPSGAALSHEVTADGMKQVRYTGQSSKSAAEFHVDAGVATPGETAKVEAMRRG